LSYIATGQRRAIASTKAKSVWQLFNYLEGLATARGRVLLLVNLDETSVCLYPGRSKGAVFVTNKLLRDGHGQKVPKWKRRCNLTHIGVVCDRADVQAVLPQFLVANERTLPARSLEALRRACPPNVFLIRQVSAWNNHALMARVVRAIADVVASLGLADVQVLLVLDAAKIHLHHRVLLACRAARMWLVVVPPRTTPFLQVLDTHAFSCYKRWLARAYQDARARSGRETGELDIQEFLQCVYDTIRHVLEGRPWAAAFEQNGFGSQQTALCSSLKRRLQLDEALLIDVSSERPTDDQVRLCFPRRFHVSMPLYWSIFDETAPPARLIGPVRRVAAAIGPRTRAMAMREAVRAAGVATAATAAASAAASGVARPRSGPRTRAMTAAAAVEAAAAASRLSARADAADVERGRAVRRRKAASVGDRNV
jgi:hypothetical protein